MLHHFSKNHPLSHSPACCTRGISCPGRHTANWFRCSWRWCGSCGLAGTSRWRWAAALGGPRSPRWRSSAFVFFCRPWFWKQKHKTFVDFHYEKQETGCLLSRQGGRYICMIEDRKPVFKLPTVFYRLQIPKRDHIFYYKFAQESLVKVYRVHADTPCIQLSSTPISSMYTYN